MLLEAGMTPEPCPECGSELVRVGSVPDPERKAPRTSPACSPADLWAGACDWLTPLLAKWFLGAQIPTDQPMTLPTDPPREVPNPTQFLGWVRGRIKAGPAKTPEGQARLCDALSGLYAKFGEGTLALA